MVWRMFLTHMLKNVVMWITCNTMCSESTLMERVPMPQNLHPS